MIYHYSTVDSTNTIAARKAAEGAVHGTVIHADQQKGGRGRAGRHFVSPPGGLYFSLIIRPDFEVEILPLITLAAGVGLCDGIRNTVDIDVHLKWPNDLYLSDRKLGGVLAESGPFVREIGPEFLVIGVGINVQGAFDTFSSSLRSKVISLYHACRGNIDLDRLLTSCADGVLESVAMLAADRDLLLDRWRSLDYLQGRNLEFDGEDGAIPAIGIGLAEDGRYIVRDPAGVEYRVLAGDINPISLKSE